MKKIFIKILSVMLTLLISVSMFVVYSYAAGTNKATISVETVSGKPGDTVKVKVNLNNNPGVSSLKFNVDYDNLLTLTNVEFSSEFGSYVTAPTPYKNPQTISMISPLKEIKVSGTFATLTFKISSTIKGSYTAKISIKYDPDDICDENLNNVDVAVVDGAVNVSGTSIPQNCVITLNTNDGTNKSTKNTVSSSSGIKLPSPQKSGYTCVGWSEDKNAVLPSYKCGTNYKPTADTNLYAVWAKNNSKVTGVKIDDVEMHYKDAMTLKPSVSTSNGAKYVAEWSSSNTDVAKVDANGKITATKRGSGTATITCKVTDQFGNTVKDTCTVSVSLTVWQWIKTYIFFGWIWY